MKKGIFGITLTLLFSSISSYAMQRACMQNARRVSACAAASAQKAILKRNVITKVNGNDFYMRNKRGEVEKVADDVDLSSFAPRPIRIPLLEIPESDNGIPRLYVTLISKTTYEITHLSDIKNLLKSAAAKRASLLEIHRIDSSKK